MIDALTLIAQVDGASKLSGRAQIIAVVITVLVLLFVIELVRRRRLVERYALMWMAAATVMVVLATWTSALDWIAESLGIASPPNALFLLGLVAIFALLLNFSVAISRLSEETKILAQTVSRLDAENREIRGEGPGANGNSSEDRLAPGEREQPQDQPPVGGEPGAE